MKPSSRPGLFVVQKHAARRLHYDFRLELFGTLRSWAVPQGLSFDPEQKRLAVEVEDHPVEYADFEGIIPEGNYGAGAVIVWDQGQWVALEDPLQGFEKGKLLFELKGYKLRGGWTLVRLKGQTKEWLLIKKSDAFASSTADSSVSQQSIFSGQTLEELREGISPGAAVLSDVKKVGAPRGEVKVGDVDLMLAESRDEPFSGSGWLFELKHDGYRLLASKQDGRVVLRYRRGLNATSIFPDIARAVAKLPIDDVILDGEVVVQDEKGKSNFQRLQKRVQLSREVDIDRATVSLPATYLAFDVLSLGEFDLRSLTLLQRKELLKHILPKVGPLKLSDHVLDQGREFFAQVEKMGLEGMVAKRTDSAYRGGRSEAWLKIRIEKVDDFVIVGFTEPKGTRTGLGSLHVGLYKSDGQLSYAGGVGTGFTDELLRDLRGRLERLHRKSAPFSGPLPPGRGHHWVEPELVCEVRYKELTEEGLLRHSVFLRLRSDKAPKECTLRGSAALEVEAKASDAARAPSTAERRVPFSNLDKEFWPEDGYTKGDLIQFYKEVSPWLLPYLRDRPVVLTRYPDGIHGKSFFQKDAPGFVPGWIRTERMWSEQASREIDYFICDDQESLLYLANLGTIPLHIWSSRIQTLQSPDWTILDLDPKEAPFSHVIRVAKEIRRLCERIEFPSYIKTSGSTGLHILLPLGKRCTYEQSRQLAELIARAISEKLPDLSTIIRPVGSRGGRVYIDYLQNGHGRTIASTFCVRPNPGAPVSTPLKWSEVTDKLDPKKFNIRTVVRRMEKLKEDPVLPVLESKPNLGKVLQRLEESLAKT